MTYHAKLSGVPMGREHPKNLLVSVGEGDRVIRLHITNDSGYSVASIALDDDQALLFGSWLCAVASGGDRGPIVSTTLDSGRFAARVSQ